MFVRHIVRRSYSVSSTHAGTTPTSATVAAVAAASVSSAPLSSSSSGSHTSHENSNQDAKPAAPQLLPPFEYKIRLRYTPFFASKTVHDFLLSQNDNIVALASTYYHDTTGVQVTLIPLSHHAHPKFFQQVDALCCQHESVLMEGRVPVTGSPYSTLVPPREFRTTVRPSDAEDSEGWEPSEPQQYWQPFSWGVKGSPKFTVVHAADHYDYEKLPWWASLRFNLPFIGSYQREKHCMDMIPPLLANGYKTFAVPWGAAHMPIFHDMLVDHGFEQVGISSIIMWTRSDGDRSAAEWHRMDYMLSNRKSAARWIWRVLFLGAGYFVLPRLIWFTTENDGGQDVSFGRTQ